MLWPLWLITMLVSAFMFWKIGLDNNKRRDKALQLAVEALNLIHTETQIVEGHEMATAGALTAMQCLEAMKEIGVVKLVDGRVYRNESTDPRKH